MCNEKDEGHRLDVIISRYTTYTRSQIKSKVSAVYVNGKLKEFSYKVKNGDIIEFEDIKPDICELQPEERELKVIYEDNDIAVIEKPYNLVVHPSPGHWNGTLVNALLYNLKDKLSTLGGYMRPGIVHRLDKETSGIMIIALNDKSHYKLSNAFKNRVVQKEYWAIVSGSFKEKYFTIDKPISRNPKNRLKMIISPEGRQAITEFEVIDTNKSFSLIKAKPITGRTHQIRVHLKCVNHPIVGDTLYGITPHKYIRELELPEGFIPLISKKISFPHPTTEKIMVFEIDLTPEFKRTLEKVGLNIPKQYL